MRIAVIGGGIAGCGVAYALARRGAAVTLIERQARLAAEASGNAMGIFHPRIEKQWGPVTRFYLSAFGYAQRQLQALGGRGEWWDRPGMLQFPKRRDPAKSEARLRELPTCLQLTAGLARFVEPEEASALTGIFCAARALYFPGGGWVRPSDWCARLTQGVALRRNAQVTSLTRGATWRLALADGETLEADRVVLATAGTADYHSSLGRLPLRRVRGQITRLPATRESAALRAILCYDGYLSPPREGAHWCGATYDYDRGDLTPDAAGNRHNLAMTERLWPSLFPDVAAEGLEARAAFRAVTPDRLPLIGEWEEGLFLSLGHGSRGLLSAPLGGELLASLLLGEPPPCEADVIAALHPGRFALR